MDRSVWVNRWSGKLVAEDWFFYLTEDWCEFLVKYCLEPNPHFKTTDGAIAAVSFARLQQSCYKQIDIDRESLVFDLLLSLDKTRTDR